MLEFKTKHGVGTLKVDGTIAEILADISLVVNQIYENLDDDNKGAFKFAFKKSVKEDVPFKEYDCKSKENDDDDFINDFIDFMMHRMNGGKKNG